MKLKCKKKKNKKQKKNIWPVYGESTVTDQTCQKWFAKFLVIIDILVK